MMSQRSPHTRWSGFCRPGRAARSARRGKGCAPMPGHGIVVSKKHRLTFISKATDFGRNPFSRRPAKGAARPRWFWSGVEPVILPEWARDGI
jgi:hypothetical protein